MLSSQARSKFHSTWWAKHVHGKGSSFYSVRASTAGARKCERCFGKDARRAFTSRARDLEVCGEKKAEASRGRAGARGTGKEAKGAAERKQAASKEIGRHVHHDGRGHRDLFSVFEGAFGSMPRAMQELQGPCMSVLPRAHANFQCTQAPSKTTGKGGGKASAK